MTHAERLARCRRFAQMHIVAPEMLRGAIRDEIEFALLLDPLARTRRHLFKSPINQPRKALP